MTGRTGVLAAALPVTLALALALWALNTFPLVQHFSEGVPYSHWRNEDRPARYMVPGDHLQLLYHFSLAGDMVRGGTEWFYNPYEFNYDGDESRREPGAYFFPFSLIFAALEGPAGPAAAWNLTGLFSIWLTALFSWLLARRFCASLPACLLASLASIALPMRWTSLMGGSPTGFAMAWLPLLWIGMAGIVLQGSVVAGVTAGLAVLLLCLGDTHSFFFGVLSMPLAALLAFTFGRPDEDQDAPSLGARVAASLPALAGIAVSYLYTRWTTLAPAGEASAGGRSWQEVSLFAPRAAGLFGDAGHGVESHIYLGYLLTACLLAAALSVLMATGRARRTALLGWTVLAAGFAAVILLALGPNGPFEGVTLKVARFLVPPYRMVRQPAKIFCLLPTLAALGLAVGWTPLLSLLKPRKALLVAAVACAALAAEYSGLYRAGICLLERKQGAYEAVVGAAAARGEVPRALAIPLWPGDSHLASVYEYFAIRHRLRLVNGYRPFVPAGFHEKVFIPFQGVNQGDLLPEQAAALIARGIRYLILHEDLYPEKVSPFPVGVTLEKFLADRRLRLIRQAGSVWAFEILDASAGLTPAPAPAGPFFPAWHESCAAGKLAGAAAMVSGDAAPPFVRLGEPGASCRLGPFAVGRYPDLHWLVRARGEGTLNIVVEKLSAAGASSAAGAALRISGPRWHWLETPLPEKEPYERFSLLLELEEGVVDLDRVILAAGRPPAALRGEAEFWPAARFFRAGYTLSPGGSVVLRREHDPADVVFYGPLSPVAAGDFDITLEYESPAAGGTLLGRLAAGTTDRRALVSIPVEAGTPARLPYRHDGGQPLRVDFTFSGRSDMEIKGVRWQPRP